MTNVVVRPVKGGDAPPFFVEEKQIDASRGGLLRAVLEDGLTVFGYIFMIRAELHVDDHLAVA